MVEFAFIPPEDVSPNSAKIYQDAREKILKNWDSYPPDLQAQYKIQLDRYDRKSPASEFVLLKGLFSMPSMCRRVLVDVVQTENTRRSTW